MRRLLVLTTFASLLLVAGSLRFSRADAVNQIYMYLYHPTGNDWNSAVLACGWHWNCDGDPNDANKTGLDWIWPDSTNWVYFRMKGVGTSTTTLVAHAYAREQYFGDCIGITVDINR